MTIERRTHDGNGRILKTEIVESPVYSQPPREPSESEVILQALAEKVGLSDAEKAAARQKMKGGR